MATREQYRELARQLSATAAIQRDLGRALPADCPPASAIVLMVLNRHGEMRMSKLAELLSIDMSVTSRHAAHVADRGWIDRQPDPQDKRSRLLRINERGRALLDEVADRYTEVLAQYLSDWSDADLGQLNALLARLRGSFGDCRARPAPATAATPRAPGPPDPHPDPGPAARPAPARAPEAAASAPAQPPPSADHDITRTPAKR
ncbi:MarR family winged helix-turn-helix transcriptional regulator [Streptomyces sp. NPDC057702]|uniref:MarR family winged helix-turn-helix transcriptional regulator n=1 Tax=unclassified Streptomyces TaxID=2593676 RepID=UPI0036C3ED28